MYGFQHLPLVAHIYLSNIRFSARKLKWDRMSSNTKPEASANGGTKEPFKHVVGGGRMSGTARRKPWVLFASVFQRDECDRPVLADMARDQGTRLKWHHSGKTCARLEWLGDYRPDASGDFRCSPTCAPVRQSCCSERQVRRGFPGAVAIPQRQALPLIALPDRRNIRYVLAKIKRHPSCPPT
jgi:hypothetical protein